MTGERLRVKPPGFDSPIEVAPADELYWCSVTGPTGGAFAIIHPDGTHHQPWDGRMLGPHPAGSEAHLDIVGGGGPWVELRSQEAVDLATRLTAASLEFREGLWQDVLNQRDYAQSRLRILLEHLRQALQETLETIP